MAVLSNKNNVPISERKCTSYRTDLHNPQAKGKTFKKQLMVEVKLPINVKTKNTFKHH